MGGVLDQYGGAHGVGRHNKRACNGGQDWTTAYISKSGVDRLADYGPGPAKDCYYDGMYLDISDKDWESFDFELSHLGLTPLSR